MNKIKILSKSLVSFFLVISFVITTTAAFAEIVGRLSVHWSPKHHSAKHMASMRKDMMAGMSFTASHKKAQKKVGR